MNDNAYDLWEKGLSQDTLYSMCLEKIFTNYTLWEYVRMDISRKILMECRRCNSKGFDV